MFLVLPWLPWLPWSVPDGPIRALMESHPRAARRLSMVLSVKVEVKGWAPLLIRRARRFPTVPDRDYLEII